MTSSERQPSPARAAHRHSLAQRVIAAVLLMLLEVSPMQVGVQNVLALGLVRSAHAAPVADPGAAPRFQPGIGQTAGAAPVPVVNITAPNAAGASLNRYRQFNVDANGLVINNSTVGGGTLLGGNVSANPLLKGRAASVIINEVGSGFEASTVNGAIEVFGPRADLVIANPNGIACNGCSFVNTPRITLATGALRFLDAPNGSASAFDSAAAWGYDVRGGDIRIGAPGGQAGIEGTVGQIDLIAQSIALHAPLRAGAAANLITGRQWVAFDAAGNAVLAANGDNSGAGYAIDATALGAVSAGRITIIATAAGPGVRADSRLAASAGDLLISANGDVSLARTYASGDVRARAQGTMTLTGDALALGDLALHAAGPLDTAALSARAIRIESDGGITSGGMQSDTTIQASAGGSFGSRGALGAAGAVTITAEQDIGIGADVHSGAVLDLTSRSGSITIAGNVTADGSTLLSAGRDIQVTGGSLSSKADITALAGRDMAVAGSIAAGRALRIDAATGKVVAGGELFSGTDLNVHAGADLTLDGQVVAGGMAVLGAGGGVTVGGVAGFNQSLDVKAGGDAVFRQSLTVVDRITVNAGSLRLGGDATAGGDIVAKTAGDATLDGKLTALSSLNLDARGAATLNGIAIVTGDAVVSSGGDMALGGNLLVGGDARLVSKGLITQTAGLVGAVGALAVSGGLGVLGNGALVAGAGATVESGAGAVAIGVVGAGGDLTINAAKNIESAGLQSGGDIRQTAGAHIVNRGMVIARGTLDQHAEGGITQAGANVGKRITATAGSDIDYSETTVTGPLELKSKQQLTLTGTVDAGDTTLEAAGRLRTSNGVQTIRGTLSATAASMLLDADATSAGNAVYTARSGDLQGAGILQSGGELTLKAGGRIERSKLVGSVGKLAVHGDQGVTLGDVIAVSGGDIGSAAGDVKLAGVTGSGGDLVVTAGGALTVDKAVTSRGRAGFSAGGNLDINGTVSTKGDIVMDAGRTLTLNADLAADGHTTLTGGDIVNQAGVSSGGDLVMQARKRLASGLLDTGANVTLGGNSITTSASVVRGDLNVTGGDITLNGKTLVRGSSTLTGRSVTNQGELLNGANIVVNAGTVTNTAGSKLVAFGDTTIAADDIVNAGSIFGANVTLNGGNAVDNTGGLVLGTKSVAVRAKTLTNNKDGKILSAGNLLVDISDPLNNTGGRLHADRDMTLQLHGATFDPGAAANGLITLGGRLTIIANDFRNTDGWTVPGKDLDLQIQQSFINRGRIEKAGDLRIATTAAIENSGQMVADGTLTLDGASIVNSGLLHANGDLSLVAVNDIVNSGRIHAQQALTLQGATLDNRNTNQDDGVTAGISAAGDMQITMGSRVDNTAGSIAAIGNVSIVAPEVRNDRGALTETIEYGRNYSTEVLDGMIVETGRTTLVDLGGEGGGQARAAIPDRTLGSYAPDYASRTVASPAMVWGRDRGGDSGSVKETVGDAITLPWVDITTVTQREGRAAVIASGRNLTIDAPTLLSNRGGLIAANGNATLNVGQLDNGRSATLTNGTVETINAADHARFISDMNKSYTYYDPGRSWVTEPLLAWELHARTVDKRYQTPGQRGAIIAGRDFKLNGASLVNAGNITVGGNTTITAGASFTNQGDYNTLFAMQAGCMAGSVSCNEQYSAPRVESFTYRSDPNALVVGGSLTIDAPVIVNTHATLAARGDVTLTADQVHNVAGVIQSTAADLVIKAREVTSRVESPVIVHESWGNMNPPEAPGCNPGNYFKDSQCSVNRDVAASPAPVLMGARDVIISGASLTNNGGLIAAGRKVDIDMRDAAANNTQVLAVNWKGYWIENGGELHNNPSHVTGGIAMLPPQNAAIQAPLVEVKVGGLLQNTGNISGQNVDLRGAHLVNGITAPNQPSPPPTGMKQVTMLTQESPVSAPMATLIAKSEESRRQAEIKATEDKILKLRLEHPDSPLLAPMVSSVEANAAKRQEAAAAAQAALREVPAIVDAAQAAAATTAPASIIRPDIAPAAKVHYLDATAARGAEVLSTLGPQQLIDRLPADLRGATPLPFAYDPFVENQLLQRQALESTGRAYYINGLSFDDRNKASLDDQQKALFYTNAIAYAETQRLHIGDALSDGQVKALDRPMLWYVEQQVPDASCRDLGALSQANCPTVTALVPVLYLDQASAERLSTQSLGLIAGDKVVADFTSRIDNSGIISGGEVSITTPDMKNYARAIDIGRAAYKVEGGWAEMTGTRIEPGGYVSAQNFAGEIDRLESVGGTLQVLGTDGSVDAAQTEALLGKLGSVLGVQSYSHTDLKDDIHVEFIKDRSNEFEQLIAVVAAVVLSFIVGPAISAYLGEGVAAGGAMAAGTAATGTTAAVGAGLGNLVVTGFITGTMASMTAQFIGTGEVNMGAALKSGLTGSLTAGLSEAAGLSQMAGIRDMGDGLLQGTINGTQAGQVLLGLAGRALISAAVGTTINGGSFGQAMLNSLSADMAALGANLIGQTTDPYSPLNVAGHAAVACLGAMIAKGDCAASAAGAAMSSLVSPLLRDQLYSDSGELVQGADGKTYVQDAYNDPGKNAAITSLSMFAGAAAAGLMGKDPLAAANAARNEALNNALSPKLKELAKAGTTCKAGTCAGYVDALQAEKTAKQQEYDACMAAADCSPIRAAELSSELFRLKSAYEQTVRQGVAVGDLKWVAGDNVVPTDYFDGLVGIGAVGVGAALRLGGAKGVPGEVQRNGQVTDGTNVGAVAADAPVTSGGTANVGTVPGLKGQLAAENLANIAAQDIRLAKAVGGSGMPNPNFSIGEGTATEANSLGQIWVGDGARTLNGVPNGLISADGTRVFRPPTQKPNTPAQFNPTGVQANFQIRDPNTGAVTSNGHMVIK